MISMLCSFLGENMSNNRSYYHEAHEKMKLTTEN